MVSILRFSTCQSVGIYTDLSTSHLSILKRVNIKTWYVKFILIIINDNINNVIQLIIFFTVLHSFVGQSDVVTLFVHTEDTWTHLTHCTHSNQM